MKMIAMSPFKLSALRLKPLVCAGVALLIFAACLPHSHGLVYLAKILELNFKPAPSDRQAFVDWWTVRALDYSTRNHAARRSTALANCSDKAVKNFIESTFWRDASNRDLAGKLVFVPSGSSQQIAPGSNQDWRITGVLIDASRDNLPVKRLQLKVHLARSKNVVEKIELLNDSIALSVKHFINNVDQDASNRTLVKNKETLRLYGKGIVHKLLGDDVLAKVAFDKAISLNSSFILPLYERGDWARVLKISPNYLPAYFSMAMNGCSDGAKKYLDKCISLDPTFAPAYLQRAVKADTWHLKDRDLLLPDLNKAIELDPMLAQAYYIRAQIREQKNDNLGAFQDVDSFAKILPDCSFVWFLRGHANSKLKRSEAAVKDYSKAIKLKSNRWEFYLFRGYQFTLIGDHKSAIKDFETTREKHKPGLQPWSIGIIEDAIADEYLLLGDKEKAQKQYEKSKVLTSLYCCPSDETSLELKNLAPERRRRYVAAINTKLKGSEAYWDRAWIRKTMCDFNGAQDDAEAAAALQADGYYKFVNRAYYRELAKNWKGALEDFEKVIKLKPEDFSGFQSCSKMCEKLGDYVGAQKYKKKAIELSLKKNSLSERLCDNRLRELFGFQGFSRNYISLRDEFVFTDNFFAMHYPQSYYFQR